MIPNKTIMFAGPDVDDMSDLAKNYIRDMKLSKDDVKLVRENGAILVKAIRDIK